MAEVKLIVVCMETVCSQFFFYIGKEQSLSFNLHIFASCEDKRGVHVGVRNEIGRTISM